MLVLKVDPKTIEVKCVCIYNMYGCVYTQICVCICVCLYMHACICMCLLMCVWYQVIEMDIKLLPLPEKDQK